MLNRQNKIFSEVYPGPAGIKLTTYLRDKAGFPGRRLRQYFFKGQVLLNSKKAHSEVKLKPGDQVEVFQNESETTELNPEAVALDIIFEDQSLLVINKPAQIAVHPSGRITSGTLANRVAAYYQEQGLQTKIRPVNRLDFGTSGLVIFAKNALIQSALSTAIQNHQIVRTYYAVVQGNPVAEEGLIDAPIKATRERRIIAADGQLARTHYRRIQSLKNASLLELTLETGRTHQIRVHLSHIGHPLLGDSRYGVLTPFIARPALHAGKLNFASHFTVPELTAPIPEDIQELLVKLK